MRKILLPLLVSTLALSCAQQDHKQKKTENTSAQVASTITLRAIEDFSILDQGDVPYYKDTDRNALAIDARIVENRNLFAQASKQFEGDSGLYDVTITIMTEEDGEPIYRLLVNDKNVAVFKAPYIGPGSNKDLKPMQHTWPKISLKTGDKIAIESVTSTNGEIPEHGGTAWARGRWQQIEFAPHDHQRFGRPSFDFAHDLLIAQFDLQPDADDVHAVAALGSMLADDDFAQLNYFAVAGSTGIQGGKYIEANALFKQAFGRENVRWTDAKSNWQASVERVAKRAKAILSKGGQVWVQEAGQSDFTADWVKQLIEDGMEKSTIKQRVIVVQHSQWNEDKTTLQDLIYVKANTNYQAIADGNKPKRKFIRKGRRGDVTPQYVDIQSKWLAAATSQDNPKKHARKLWQQAVEIIEKSGFNAYHSSIPKGGVDFSDVVESWWIFQLNNKANSVHAFWDRYVTDVELDTVNPPPGRLAIVIDGNSPDPDDIGATPVMFGLLQHTGLSERLVHLSHSCDLDPFKNKGLQQINAKNEAVRQKVLHNLTAEGIKLFGPFNNLRNYYNCRADQQGATQDLVDAINASSAQDPLWIIEAGEPDLIGYALQAAKPNAIQHVHVVSHHPANDDSGDYFTWQQILDFGVTEHQIGDQNVGLQTPIEYWDWAKVHKHPGIRYIWDMLAYAEQDGIVDFQTNKFDCSDAGMVYWWITGANNGGNNHATPIDIRNFLPQ
ncbi:hypothetical protein DS2_13844 [Catenovulum agarivorans DS-2]|uniref:Lipoprotein n=1 Tax=Catenovulum agarivorans DS-2 TaxID=1328313 RepID=W7QV36_9ALTE|nr:hypothetical protein [Catenovulum agarivorans]EWH09160.1 hypothetical protein DS2_13844 [Catenovulum agarivorans DS-2]